MYVRVIEDNKSLRTSFKGLKKAFTKDELSKSVQVKSTWSENSITGAILLRYSSLKSPQEEL